MIVLGYVLVMCYINCQLCTCTSQPKILLVILQLAMAFLEIGFKYYLLNFILPTPKSLRINSNPNLDELSPFLKSRFINARSDSTYQSIDNSITKFKGPFIIEAVHASQTNQTKKKALNTM